MKPWPNRHFTRILSLSFLMGVIWVAFYLFVPAAQAQTVTPPLCATLPENQQQACFRCFEDQSGAWTAIGCIPASPQRLLTKFLGLGMSMGGGIAFLLVLLGGFQVLTSAGNPEQLSSGRELVGSAITGLLFIMFSLFILRFAGFSILGIPGFG